jgi:CRP-like cAMP-binding protein
MSMMNLVADPARERRRLPWEDLLERHRLFAGLAPAEMGRLLGAQAASEQTFDPGEVIVQQGQPGESVFFVGTGSVKVSLVAEGQTLELATLRRGDFFGEMALFEPGARAATVTAVQECVLLEVPSEGLRELMVPHPALELALLHTLTERLRKTNERVLALKLREAPEALRLLEARLGAEVRVVEASLKAAHTVFEQTRVRTDEVISSADRTRSRLTYIASTIATVFTLAGMGLGGVGLNELMNLRKWRDEADKAASTVEAFNKDKPKLDEARRLINVFAEEAQKLGQEAQRMKEALIREQVLAIRTALDQGHPAGAMEHLAQLQTLGWLNDNDHVLDLVGEVEAALRATRDPSGVVASPQEAGRKLPDFERLLDRVIENAADPKTRARAYLLRLVNANLVSGGALGDHDRAVLAQFQKLLEQHRAEGLLSGAKEWERDDFLPGDPTRREAFRRALRQVATASPKNESPRAGRGPE